MLTLLAGGRLVDPTQDLDGPGDLWLEDGRIAAPPSPGREPDERHDVTGTVIMAGGIDIHSHIAGFNVNTARLLLPEQRSGGGFDAVPACSEIGRLYAAMGYTLVVEPAILPHQALQAHLELACIPFIDKAILAVAGNEDYLLRLLRGRKGEAAVADYTARVLAGARALGVKAINPGGSAAFKANARSFGLDDEVPGYGVSSRAIMQALQHAVLELGLPHPLHLHCNNLGIPGNVGTALATIEAAEGLRLHLAHLQFYAYGTEGQQGFSSAAAQLAEVVNGARNITADVGQVMFGQTVTISCDTLRQFNSRGQAHPRKWLIYEGDGNGGGIVPYRYRRKNLFNAVQWAAGLELFLLIDDPSRLFFTTDHPNGAPFTAYPDLFALLMNRDLRTQWIGTLPEEAMKVSTLPSIGREYDWSEIATMTRVGPARLLGLADRGHLAPGARADIAVYRPQSDRAEMFRNALLVFKDGKLIMREGKIVATVPGRALTTAPGFDAAVDHRLAAYYEETFGVAHTAFDVPGELAGLLDEPFETVPCRV
ncbi:MAG: formylmethanofuran dehydrogenase subunit A [Pseudomonadota bacterium]|nr:formylmethanofuran dehydrogenase subunit A [Pseudomonadota bacterium]